MLPFFHIKFLHLLFYVARQTNSNSRLFGITIEWILLQNFINQNAKKPYLLNTTVKPPNYGPCCSSAGLFSLERKVSLGNPYGSTSEYRTKRVNNKKMSQGKQVLQTPFI